MNHGFVQASLLLLPCKLLCVHLCVAMWLIPTQILVIQIVDAFPIPLSMALLPSDALNESIYRAVAWSEYSNLGKC